MNPPISVLCPEADTDPVLELLDYPVGLLLTAFLDCIMIKIGFLHFLLDAVQLAYIYKGFACVLHVLIESFHELTPYPKLCIKEDSFYQISDASTIYVHSESLEAYNAADGWSDFAMSIQLYDFL